MLISRLDIETMNFIESESDSANLNESFDVSVGADCRLADGDRLQYCREAICSMIVMGHAN